MIINLSNQLTQVQGIQQTYVASAISAGVNFSPVKNIAGFNNQWAVQIGQTGEETAEIMILSGAPSGTTFSFGTSPSHPAGTTLFSHNQDTPIYQVHYDQIIFYRSTNGTTGPFSALATVSVTPDSLYTQYNDTQGAAGYAYYGQYYNSSNGDLSGSSAIFLPGGPTYYSLQKIRQRVKDKLYSAGYIRDDGLITDWINEGIELFTNSAIKVNQGYMLTSGTFAYGTTGIGTITDAYFKQVVKVEISSDGGNTWTPTQEIAPRSYSNQDYYSAQSPRHAWVGENTFQILPYNTGGSARMTYSQRFTPLVYDSDELTSTLKAYTTAFVEYALSVAYGLDQKDTQQQEHYQKFLKYQQDFISEITPRDETGAKTIDLTEGISGINEDVIMEEEYFL